MATDPEAIRYWLDKPPPKLPNWKTLPTERLHELIEKYTGRRFRRTKGPPLYDHQFRTLAMALCLRQSLSYLGMRTGKTRIVLEAAEHLRKARKWEGRGLIIVPSPTVLDVWEEQIEEYTNLTSYIVRDTSDRSFLRAAEGRQQLTVVSWSTLQQVLTRKMPFLKYKKVQLNAEGKPILKLQLDVPFATEFGQCFSFSAIDEIHMCKDRNSLTFRMGAAIVQDHEYRMGLTGTPFGRYPLDVWPEAFLVDGGLTLTNSYYFFQEAFSIKKKSFWGGPHSFDYKFDTNKLPILASKLSGISIAYKLEELRQINEKPIITRLQFTKQQAAKYQGALSDHIKRMVEEDDEVTPKGSRNLFAKLRQISSGHIPFIDDYGELQVTTMPTHAKLIWLRNAINEGLGENPFLIYYEFNASGQQLMDEFKNAKIKVGRVWGEGKNNSKHIRDFQTGKLRGLVLNSKSGNVGIDLWPADYMCFYESTTSPIIRQQAEKRPFGPKRGERPVVIEDLIVSTTEEKIYGYIKEGKDLLSATIHTPKGLFKWLT